MIKIKILNILWDIRSRRVKKILKNIKSDIERYLRRCKKEA